MHTLFSDFKFSALVSLASIGLASLMLTASVWQWHRYHYKLELQDKIKNHHLEQAIPLRRDELSTRGNTLLNDKVALSGHFDVDKELVVINRSNGRQAGFWLLTPFILENSNDAVLVSRGFIPFEDDNPQSWQKYTPQQSGQVTIEVVLQNGRPTRNWFAPMNPPSERDATFKRKWSYVDVAAIAEQFQEYHLLPDIYGQQLSPEVLNGFPEQSIQIGLPPSTHFWYSIEWVLLALSSLAAGLAMQIFPNRRKRLRGTTQYNENLALHGVLAIIIGAAHMFPQPASATSDPQTVKQEAKVIERLGSQVDQSLQFRDERGATVDLASLNPEGLPIILAPVYYECPELCGLTQTGIAKMLNAMDLKLGREFLVVSLSFNPRETAAFAKEKAKLYREKLSDIAPENRSGWHFLVGSEKNIKALTKQVGFYYAPDGEEFMHAAVLTVLSPDGMISRYLYGIQFPVEDVRLALLEAADGKIGSFAQKVLLYCFRYDHIEGRYTLAIMKVTRVICLGFFALLVAFLAYLRFRENRQNRLELPNS